MIVTDKEISVVTCKHSNLEREMTTTWLAAV